MSSNSILISLKHLSIYIDTYKKGSESMTKVKRVSPSESKKRMRPALTPEARENRLISLAMDNAEEQLLNRTASSQVVTHYLKLGTQKYQMEIEKLKKENELLRAKTEAIESAKHIEELYADAIKAMQRYSGHGDVNES